MRYDASARMLTLEATNCRSCRSTREDVPPGKQAVFAMVVCPKCKGSGRRGGGNCRECRALGMVTDYSTVAELVPCSHCGGDYQGFDLENFCDKAPQAVIDDLPIRVIRQERDTSWNESFLGLGCLWSCVDYGRAAKQSDNEVIASIREDLKRSTQATNIVAKYERDQQTAKVCDYLAVVVSYNGYSVRPGWDDDPSTVEDAARELNRDDAMMYGMAVYASGGHGTMAAATAKYPKEEE